MQFKAVILGTSILKKRDRPPSQTVRPTKLEKRDRHPTLLLPPGLQLNSLHLQCSVRVQSKNGVDLVEVNISYKSEKTSGQTIPPKKIKTVALLYLIMAV